MIQILKDNIETALAHNNSGEMEKLNVILRDKKKVLAKLAHVKEDYAILADEIDILREKKKKFLEQRAKTEGLKR